MATRIDKAMERAEKRAAQFNDKHPEGTAVRYFPISGRPEFIESKTRGQAWALYCGEAVVAIEGRSGGMSLNNIEII